MTTILHLDSGILLNELSRSSKDFGRRSEKHHMPIIKTLQWKCFKDKNANQNSCRQQVDFNSTSPDTTNNTALARHLASKWEFNYALPAPPDERAFMNLVLHKYAQQPLKNTHKIKNVDALPELMHLFLNYSLKLERKKYCIAWFHLRRIIQRSSIRMSGNQLHLWAIKWTNIWLSTRLIIMHRLHDPIFRLQAFINHFSSQFYRSTSNKLAIPTFRRSGQHLTPRRPTRVSNSLPTKHR